MNILSALAHRALALVLSLAFATVLVLLDPPAPAHAAGPNVLVVGDSYTEGVGDDDPSDGYGWAPIAGAQLGWTLTRDGRGGSGYSNPTTYGAGVFCTRLYNHPADAYDLVVIQGSSNDQAYLSQLAGDANKTIRTVKARYPSARIVLLGPTNPYGSPGTNLLEVNRKMKAAAAYAGVPYIDPLGEQWFVPGDGSKYAQASGSGKGHPDEDGYQLIADRFVQDYRAL